MRRSSKASKKTLILATSAVAITLAVAYFSFEKNPGAADDSVVAKVNGESIYHSEAVDKLNKLQFRNPEKVSFDDLDEKAKEAIINEVAAHKLLTEKALQKKLDKNKDFNDKIAIFKEQLLKEMLLSDVVKDQITEEKLQEAYDELVSQLKGKKDYKISHIVLKDEADARVVYKKLKRNRSSFEKLAKQESVDLNSASKGGERGWFIVGGLEPQIDPIIQTMKKNEVSEPIETDYGWVIVRLDDIRPSEPRPYDQVKGQLAQSLSQKIIADYVNGLVESAKIEMQEQSS